MVEQHLPSLFAVINVNEDDVIEFPKYKNMKKQIIQDLWENNRHESREKISTFTNELNHTRLFFKNICYEAEKKGWNCSIKEWNDNYWNIEVEHKIVEMKISPSCQNFEQ